MAEGIHYLLGPKSSAMHRWTTLEPVKDLSIIKHRICRAMFLVKGVLSSEPGRRSIVNNLHGTSLPMSYPEQVLVSAFFMCRKGDVV